MSNFDGDARIHENPLRAVQAGIEVHQMDKHKRRVQQMDKQNTERTQQASTGRGTHTKHQLPAPR
jgi:hypothetical protein